MKKTILSALIAASTMMTAQTTWKMDNSHSKVGFSVVHMMVSETEGKFKIYEGKVTSPSEKDFSNATILFTADVSSINTDDEKRDAHLKSPDFFDVEKFPKMSFSSTSMKKGAGNTYTLTGDLTIKGVTKKVTLTAVYGGTAKDPWGNTKAGFTLKGKINRKDFGLTWNAALETGGVVVSEEVTIDCKIELLLQK